MSGIWPDFCKRIKSRLSCWCSCICCPGGDVFLENPDEVESEESSLLNKPNNITTAYHSIATPELQIVRNHMVTPHMTKPQPLFP